MEKIFNLKNQIETWLLEQNYKFSLINEPNHQFHFILYDVGVLKMTIEVFQEKKPPDLILGFMTFLSKELTFKIYKFGEEQKSEFKKKVDIFLSTLRVDYRTGIRQGHEIVSESGIYGAKYFLKTNGEECDRKKFLKLLEMVKETGMQVDKFLYQEFKKL